MYDTKKIFQKRIQSHFASLWSLYKSSIDWIIWLYFIIPLVVIAVYHYIQWWTTTWEMDMLLTTIEVLIYFGLFLMMLNGNIRFFQERADELFFRQYREKYLYMKRLGIYYSVIVSLLLWVVIYFVITPIFIVQLEKSWVYFILLFFFHWSGTILLATLKQVIGFYTRGWLYYIGLSVMFLITLCIYSGILYIWNSFEDLILMVITVIVMIYLSYLVLNFRIHMKGTFLEELANEITLKYRFTSLALQSASYIGAPQFQHLKRPKYNKRPWLFRDSGTIFSKRTPQNGFTEFHIKYLIRNKNRWMLMFQLTGALLFVITIIPDTLKWDYDKILHFSMKSVFWINAPFLLVISAWAGLLLLPWWGFIALSCVGLSISAFIQPFLAK